jgi:CHAD domain-containing protein
VDRKRGFCAFGAQFLLNRLEVLTKETKGVCEAGDIECVHRMRVASRRLRSVLSVFHECISEKRYSSWRKGVRSITRVLGDARDLDVQITFLQEYLEGVDSTRLARGPQRLLLRLRQKREKAQDPVVKALGDFARSGIAEAMARHLSAFSEAGGQAREVRPRAVEAVSSRVDEVLGFEACVDQPENREGLHAMRIANKRLRYVMEIFAPLYEDGLVEPLQMVREFHSLLGDIHDCDVWDGFLPLFLEEERRRTLEFFGHCRFFSRIETGIGALAENRRAFRQERYGVFRELFHKTRRDGFWENLSGSLEILTGSERKKRGGKGDCSR